MWKHGVKALLALLFCWSGANTMMAQQAPKYDALLWKISGGDLKEPSYLYGTMHVSSKVAFHLSEEFFSALNESELVALEMDPALWLGELADAKWFSALSAMGSGMQGSEDLYRDAFKLTFPDRRMITEALARDPEVVNDLLYRMTAGQANHEEDTYLDLFIYQCGRRSGKPVLGLENMEHAMLQLVKAVNPIGAEPDPARQKKIREAMVSGIDPTVAIEDSYRAQDLDRMDTLFDLTSANNAMRTHLIDERNLIFIEALLPEMSRRSVFTGVGAMHLPGVNGMIELLRAKGYTVEPVRGAVNARSRSAQHKHETIYHPVEWIEQWPADSAFSMDLPAALHDLPMGEEAGAIMLAADMVNASHFMVQRIPTYAAIRGLSSEHVLGQVDSALYEGVPGRISKTARSTTNTGWPAIDVSSQDRQGRVVHHKIVVSPFEIFVFERTTRQNAQAERDGERAFASIRFAPLPPATTTAWSPSYGGYQVELPVLRRTAKADPRMGWIEEARLEQVHVTQAIDPATQESMLTMSAFFPDVTTVEQDTFELAVLVEECGKLLGATGIVKTPVAGDPRSLRGHGVRAGGDTVHYMVALSGDRYDLLLANASAPSASRFFDSYKRLPYRSSAPMELFKDTLMHFSVRTSSTHQDLLKELSGFGEYFQQMAGKLRREMENPQEAEDRTLLYRSSTTPEAILVEFDRFHRFGTVENEAEFWDGQITDLTNEGRLTLKDRRTTGEQDTRREECLLTDSASSRTVRVVMQLCPGALYTLRAVADPAGELSAWADSFLVSFHPDSAFSEGTFAKKGGVLLQWLTGADSAHVEQARRSFYSVQFEDKDAPALIAYIRSEEARDEEDGRRVVALDKLGALHHPEVMPFLRSYYTAIGDTVDVRFAVLEALAAQKTRTAATVFMDLIIADPPLTDSEWMPGNTFGPFFDTLQVAKHLFPRAWDLMVFPEYEDPVLKLAAALVEKKLMAPAEYASRKQELLLKARSELKRAIANARDGGAQYEYEDEEDRPTGSSRNFAWENELTFADEAEILKEHEVRDVDRWSTTYEAYHRLLLPFIQDPAVRAYFDQALGCGADEVELATATFLLKNNAAVPAALWQRYATRSDARLWTYRTLKALGHPELFDASLLTAEGNAMAYYLSGYTDHEEDSVHVLGRREGSSRFGNGPVYFIATRSQQDNEPDEWSICCSGTFKENASEPFEERFIYNEYSSMTDLKEAEGTMNEMLSNLRYLGRARWRSGDEMDYRSYLDY